MAYTLSVLSSSVPYTFEVNGTAVTLPYTLQDGDVIQIYRNLGTMSGMLYVNETGYRESSSLSINVSDTNIVINSGAGGVND